MNERRRHWLEKAQVQATAAVALAAVYFLAWPLLKPWDVQGAISFLGTGEIGHVPMLVVIVALVSLFCSTLTLQARPEGAILTVLVALAGLSFRSGQMRTLLWRWPEDPRGLFALLSLEMLLLTLVLLEALILVLAMRLIVRQLKPGWVWKEPEDPLAGKTGAARILAATQAGAPGQSTPAGAGQGHSWRLRAPELLGELGAKQRAKGQATNALLLELAVALVLLTCTFRSSDRGQIAFAVGASFFLAALVAHQAFPVGRALPLWVGPIVLGLLVYLLGIAIGVKGPGPTWYNALVLAIGLPIRAALPIDWLTLGCGGAFAGFWLSRRLHHARLHIEPEKPAT